MTGLNANMVSVQGIDYSASLSGERFRIFDKTWPALHEEKIFQRVQFLVPGGDVIATGAPSSPPPPPPHAVPGQGRHKGAVPARPAGDALRCLSQGQIQHQLDLAGRIRRCSLTSHVAGPPRHLAGRALPPFQAGGPLTSYAHRVRPAHGPVAAIARARAAILRQGNFVVCTIA